MAGPVSVGTVYIKVRPNTKGFRQEVERDLAGLRDVKVKVDPNTTGLKQKIERAADGAKANVQVDVDKKHLKGQLGSIQKAAPTKLKTTMKVVADTNAAIKSLRGLESYLDKFSEVDVFDFNTSNGAAEQLQWKMLGVRQSLARSTAEAKNLTEHLPGKDDIEEIRRIGKALDRMFRKDYGTPNFADLPGISALNRQTRRWMSLLRSRSREAADAVASPFRSVGDVVGRQMSSAADKAGSSIRRSVSNVANGLKSSPKKILDSARDLGYFFGTEFEKGYNQRADRDGFGGSLVEDVERLRQRTRAARLEQQLTWDAARSGAKEYKKELRDAGDINQHHLGANRDEFQKELYKRVKMLRDFEKEYQKANPDWKGKKSSRKDQFNLEETTRKLRRLTDTEFNNKLPEILDRIHEKAEKLRTSWDTWDKFEDSMQKLRQMTKAPVQGPELGPMEDKVREAIRLRREYENASRLGKARIWARDNEHVQRLNRGLRATADYAKKAGPPIQHLGESVKSIDFRKKLSAGADNAKQWGRFLNPLRRIPDSFKGRKSSGLFDGFKSGLVSMRHGISEGVDGLRRMDLSFLKVRRSADKAGRQTKKSGGLFKRMRKFIYSGDPNATRILGMTGTGWMVSAVAAIAAPAIGLIQGALMALPSLALAGAAALGVVAIGFDGIKDAAGAAGEGFYEMKNAVSDVFRERMTPQFAQLGDVLSAITPNAVNVANGFSDFTQGMVDAVSSGKGLTNIQKVMDRTGKMMSKLKPFANDFTDALLQAGEAGSRAFPLLTRQLNNFGRNFKKYIDTISEDGTLQRGVESTYRLIGSFGNNVGKILASAFEELPKAEEGFTKLFDGLGDGISAMMPAFTTFGSQIASILGDIASGIGTLFDTVGPKVQNVLNDIGPSISDLLSGAGQALLPVVDGLVSFLEGIAPGVADVFSGIGNSLEDAGKKLSQSNLSEDLKSIGEDLGKIFSISSNQGEGFQLVNDKDIRVLNDFTEDLKAVTSALSEFSEVTQEKGLLKGLDNLISHLPGAEHINTRKLKAAQASIEFLVRYDVKEDKPLDSQISHVITNAKQAVKDLKAQGKVEVDIEPEIKMLKDLKGSGNIDEVNRVIDELATKLQGGAASKGIRPIIDIDPEINVSDAFANVDSLLMGPIQNLEALKIDFLTQAESIASQLKVDISPQVEMLWDAGSEAEAREAMNNIVESLKGSAEAEGHEVKIPVDPKAEVNPAANIEGEMQAAIEPAKQSLTQAFQNMGADLNATTTTELDSAMQQVDAAVSEAANGIGTSLGEALGGVEIDMSGFATQISTALGDVSTTISEKVQEIGTQTADAMTGLVTELGGAMEGIGSTIGDAMRGISDSVGTAMSDIPSQVTGALSGLPGEVGGYFSEIASSAETQGNAAKDSFVGAMQAMKSESVAAAGEIKSGVESALKMDLTSSGAAVGQTFANGIRSKVGEVSAAANELAAAARDKFPNSPAKEGPFSGKGWIDKSGDAIGITFATGLRRQVKNVSDAASELTGAARAEFNDIAVAPESTMRAFQKKKILDPVLEHNAEQYARFREANEKAEEAHQKRLGQIAESKAKDKSKSLAKADEDYQKRLADNRKRLEESLKEPDYTEIDLSFNSYWVNGLKEMFKEKLGNLAHDLGLADKTRAAAKEAIRVGREQFGDHPIFAQVEANVDSEHFEWTVEEAIRESGLNEVPINFVIDNLNQLKKDLNMGDGVVSRGIDVAMDYNFNDTDAKRYKEEQSKTEVHYHVEDMNEAIRLEQLRERKKMMKVR